MERCGQERSGQDRHTYDDQVRSNQRNIYIFLKEMDNIIMFVFDVYDFTLNKSFSRAQRPEAVVEVCAQS